MKLLIMVGNIYDGYLGTEGRVEVIVENGEQEILIVLENSQRFLKSYSYYNANRKGFTIKFDFDNRYIELKNYLYDKFKEQNIFINTIDYINIQYIDVEHNFHNEWYELNGDELFSRKPERGNYQTFLSINSMKDEEVYEVILDILNEINQ